MPKDKCCKLNCYLFKVKIKSPENTFFLIYSFLYIIFTFSPQQKILKTKNGKNKFLYRRQQLQSHK
jgi:hypothetical protein